MDKTQRKTIHGLDVEMRCSLPGAGIGKKGARMTFLSQRPPGLALNRDRHDAPPRDVLPLLIEVFIIKTCAFFGIRYRA